LIILGYNTQVVMRDKVEKEQNLQHVFSYSYWYYSTGTVHNVPVVNFNLKTYFFIFLKDYLLFYFVFSFQWASEAFFSFYFQFLN
jgi:hypothetical protein